MNGVINASGGNSDNWNSAYNWGNHADAGYLTSVEDVTVGNEVTDATNSTLTRSGSGTHVDPYTLALNMGNANTWTAAQTFSGNTYFPGTSVWTSTGSVGIGTTNPGAGSKLEVWNGNVTVLNGGVLANTGFWGDILRTNWGNDLTLQSSYADKGILFRTQSGEKMRIDALGNVGIGKTNPSFKLDVNGDINSAGTLYAASGIITATTTPAVLDVNGIGNSSHIRLFSGQDNSQIFLSDYAGTMGIQLWHTGKAFFAGNVGIGTNSPASILHLIGNSPKLKIQTQTNLTDPSLEFVKYGVRTMEIKLMDGGAGTGLQFIDQNSEQVRMYIKASTGNVGIGTIFPDATLDVNGQVKISGGSPGAGKVLTSDASGLATWETPASAGSHFIGEAYGGGIVFYVYDNGQHGLIAATADQSAGIQWSNGVYRYTGTTGDGLGAGAMNTTLIVAAQMSDNQAGNFAAKVCTDYSATDNGIIYGDWYLPSKYESDLLFLQKTVVGGFSDSNYWTSTEESFAESFAKHKYFGSDPQTFPSDVKYHTFSVRAIRAF